jgi:hypothetical protein
MNDNDHIRNLKTIRDQWVEERRALAAGFLESTNAVDTVAKVASKQAEIDALDRAIADEKRLRPGKMTQGPLSL